MRDGERAAHAKGRITCFLFIAGLVMFFDGFFAAMDEHSVPEPSAIRGTENVCEYGLGLIIMGLERFTESCSRF
jgi:hypothetical protein